MSISFDFSWSYIYMCSCCYYSLMVYGAIRKPFCKETTSFYILTATAESSDLPTFLTTQVTLSFLIIAFCLL